LQVTAKVNREKRVEMEEFIQEYLPAKAISLRTLRSIGGKANSMATLLHGRRPFLSEIRAAINLATNDDSSCNTPRNCVWIRQVLPACLGRFAFLSEQQGTIIQTVTVAAHASKLGCGTVLTIHSFPVAFIASILDKNDRKHEDWLLRSKMPAIFGVFNHADLPSGME
jgi:hypothetical protein